jgi:hypothetical protein
MQKPVPQDCQVLVIFVQWWIDTSISVGQKVDKAMTSAREHEGTMENRAGDVNRI